jgi:hypothetical protein
MEETAVDIDRSLWRIVVIGVATVGAALVMGLMINGVRTNVSIESAVFLIMAAIIWSVFLFLQMFMVKSMMINTPLILGQVVAMIIASFHSVSLYLIIAGVIFYAFLLVGFTRGRWDLMNYLKIRFFKIGTRALPLFVTGLALFLAIYFVSAFDESNFAISEKIFGLVVGSASPVLEKAIPGFDPNMSVSEFLRLVARQQVPEGVVTSEELIDQTASTLRQTIQDKTGASIGSGESVQNSLYRNLVNKLSNATAPIRAGALAIVGIGLFFGIKAVAFFVNWIILLIAFMLYRILLVVNFFYIGVEDRKKEVIVLK